MAPGSPPWAAEYHYRGSLAAPPPHSDPAGLLPGLGGFPAVPVTQTTQPSFRAIAAVTHQSPGSSAHIQSSDGGQKESWELHLERLQVT